MTGWPTLGNGLLEKAVQSLQAPKQRGARKTTTPSADQAIRRTAIEATGPAAPDDLRTALDRAAQEVDLTAACARVQACLGVEGQGLAPLHFDYLSDARGKGSWFDMTPAERYRLLSGYAVSEIMAFAPPQDTPAEVIEDIADTAQAPIPVDLVRRGKAVPRRRRGPLPSNALDAFRKTVEVVKLPQTNGNARASEVRVYAGQWRIERVASGAWQLRIGEDSWTTGPKLTLDDLEELLFEHAVSI